MSAPEPDLDDAAASLIGAADQGDDEAWSRLLRAVHPRVYRWALGLCGDPDEADDITQDALVRLYRHLPGFAGRSRFTVWLYRLTWNAAAARRRQAWWRRRAPLRLAQSAVTEPRTGEDPGDCIDTTRAAALVRAAFIELPPRQRAIFDLADLQGYAPVEIAELLGMNPATVRVHLLKARRAVRAKLLQWAPALAPGARHLAPGEGR